MKIQQKNQCCHNIVCPLGTCIPKNFAKVLRTPILYNANGWLLLKHLREIKIAVLDKLTVLVGKFCKKTEIR